jgi:autotransporter-associated beta strand protein
MRLNRASFFAACVLPLAMAAAQNTRPEDTPPIIQVTLGPDYRDLPEDGGMYCVPTSYTMALFWLNSVGFTTLAPQWDPSDPEAAYNLDRVIGGLMGTGDGTKGGTTGQGEYRGMDLYLKLKGLSGSFSGTSIAAPTSGDLAGAFPETYSFAVINIAWYKQVGDTSTYDNNSGHNITLVDYTQTGPNSGTATINNPEPRSLYDVPNLPDEARQTPEVAPVGDGIVLVNSGTVLTRPYLQFITPTHTGSNGHLAVINALGKWTISASPGFTPATFVLTQDETINTNGGSFTAEAPLDDGAGDFGLIKTGSGTMTLTGSNTTSGVWQVENGTLESTLTTDGVSPATPFGTGGMVLSGDSTLALTPALSSAAPGSRDVALQVASGSGRSVSIASGHATLAADRGGNDSLTVTVGGQTNGTTASLALDGFATLAIRPGDGLGALGSTTKVLVHGTGQNVPMPHNGLVDPAIVGQENDGSLDGAFLTYEAAAGFSLAATVSGTTFAGTDSTTVFATDGPTSLAAGATGTVAALIAANDITGGSDSRLEITPDGATHAGLILNGATLSVSEVNFGDRTAYVYANTEGGEIAGFLTAANVVIFGPGETTLSGTSANITGQVAVNSGTLTVTNQGIGNASAQVGQNATLQATGTLAGAVTIQNGGTLLLAGGTLTGDLTLDSQSQIAGSGRIEYASGFSLQGQVGSTTAAGQLLFESSSAAPVSVEGGTIFNFTLASLTGHTPGEDWTFFDFRDGLTAEDGFVINLNFTDATDPGNPDAAAYWSLNHEWNLMLFGEGSAPDLTTITLPEGKLFPTGTFAAIVHEGEHGQYLALSYTAVPEPASSLLLLTGLAAGALTRRGGLIRRRIFSTT